MNTKKAHQFRPLISGLLLIVALICASSQFGMRTWGADTGAATVQAAVSHDIYILDNAFRYGYVDNLINVDVNGKPMATLSINNSTSIGHNYSIWTRDLYWGFLGWAQVGDDSVLPVMKSSLRLLIMARNRNQALGQNKGWPLNDGRFYIPEAYMADGISPASGFFPWDSESQADFLLLACNYWKLSGDKAFIKSIWGDISYVTETLQLLDTDGNSLPDATQGTYDYQNVQNAEEPLMCAKASLAYSSVAELARMLGKNDEANDLEKLAAHIRETMNKDVANGGLWDSTNGCYVNMRKFFPGGRKVDHRFIPYENLVPIWCGMTSDKQNDAIFAKLDHDFDKYYNLKYGPEYCAPAVGHNKKSILDCSSVPWLGFLDVYLRGKAGHNANRSKIYDLLISHAHDAGVIPFPEGAGIHGDLTGNSGRTWDNGNFFQMLICGIYGLEKTRDGIRITAPERIDSVPLTELRDVCWRKAVYNFKWNGEGKSIESVVIDGNRNIRSTDGIFNLAYKSGTHEVDVNLMP
jgi:hypothetical protein